MNLKKARLRPVVFILLLGFGVTARAAELPAELVPIGEAVGIDVKSEGVIVAELSELEDDTGRHAPARDAGLLPGDVIIRLDGRRVGSSNELVSMLEESGGRTVQLTVRRGSEEFTVPVTPFDDGGRCFLGLWARDGLTGIGTLTYYDPATGSFGALGHPVSDGETGVIIPLGEGRILPAEVTGVTPGKAGSPGKLGGVFRFDAAIGEIEKNCVVGIFGEVTDNFSCDTGKKLPVAREDEIKVGTATILTGACGEVREYSVEITRLYRGSSDGRSMMLKVTDPDLLALTGGIVQGMSGSPIIQNGKLVGAVTHVLINDPHKGYGVSIEDMLEAAEAGEKSAA